MNRAPGSQFAPPVAAGRGDIGEGGHHWSWSHQRPTYSPPRGSHWPGRRAHSPPPPAGSTLIWPGRRIVVPLSRSASAPIAACRRSSRPAAASCSTEGASIVEAEAAPSCPTPCGLGGPRIDASRSLPMTTRSIGASATAATLVTGVRGLWATSCRRRARGSRRIAVPDLPPSRPRRPPPRAPR